MYDPIKNVEILAKWTIEIEHVLKPSLGLEMLGIFDVSQDISLLELRWSSQVRVAIWVLAAIVGDHLVESQRLRGNCNRQKVYFFWMKCCVFGYFVKRITGCGSQYYDSFVVF